MTEPSDDSASLAAAREIFQREVAADDLQREFALILDRCDEEKLLHLVTLAWRHQFADDRAAFKRAVHELQEQISLQVQQGGTA